MNASTAYSYTKYIAPVVRDDDPGVRSVVEYVTALWGVNPSAVVTFELVNSPRMVADDLFSTFPRPIFAGVMLTFPCLYVLSPLPFTPVTALDWAFVLPIIIRYPLYLRT